MKQLQNAYETLKIEFQACVTQRDEQTLHILDLKDSLQAKDSLQNALQLTYNDKEKTLTSHISTIQFKAKQTIQELTLKIDEIRLENVQMSSELLDKSRSLQSLQARLEGKLPTSAEAADIALQ